MNAPRMATAGGGAVALAGALCALVYLPPLPERLVRAPEGTTRLYDARGQLLRHPAGADGRRARFTALERIPPALALATVVAEDQRLGRHLGIDPIAVARAIGQNVGHLRTVSGASTLAMQLARIVWDLPRNAAGKIAQAVLGTWLQARLGPRGVLEAYLNLAPYGRDLRGFEVASRAYFGKPPRDLTLGEAVALACLPRAPTLYDPYRGQARLVARRAYVLARMERAGLVSAAARREAQREPLVLVPFARTFRAPHLVEVALAEAAAAGHARPAVVETTVDPEVQRAAQSACRSTAARLGAHGVRDCAVVAMRVSTAEVLALVGSSDFADPEAGQFDAALALRQPGSALKPFVYALAFERGWTPASVLYDVETRFAVPGGAWAPTNYDRRFHGAVRAREALANSYNVPAARLVEQLGVPEVVARLRALGLRTLSEPPEHYGVGIALGSGEVRLVDLVAAYATLARGGTYLAPTTLRRARDGHGRPLGLGARAARRVFSEPAAYLVGHVLADRAARRASFGVGSVLDLPFDAAVKTGTSSDYRDNWTIGWANDVAVGVWVGRPDGGPMLGVSGVTGAAPVWRRVLAVAAGRGAPQWPLPPPGVELRRSGAILDLAISRGDAPPDEPPGG